MLSPPDEAKSLSLWGMTGNPLLSDANRIVGSVYPFLGRRLLIFMSLGTVLKPAGYLTMRPSAISTMATAVRELRELRLAGMLFLDRQQSPSSSPPSNRRQYQSMLIG
jgi:hypothetical protein